MTNLKVRTPDVAEIQDVKIKASSAHIHIGTGVSVADNYDAVLNQIALSSPTMVQKDALDAADSPSGINPYITESDLIATLDERIPWRTIGPLGSDAEFTGATNAVFTTAFASGDFWYLVLPGIYTFASTVIIPQGVKVTGVTADSTVVTGNTSSALFDMGQASYLGFMTVSQAGSGSAVQVTVNDVALEYLLLEQATTNAKLIDAAGVSNLRMFSVSSNTGRNYLIGCTDVVVHGCLFNDITVSLELSACFNPTVTSCIFKSGLFEFAGGTNLRAVANHFADGITDGGGNSGTLLRANTPNTVNNEADDFANLLAYIGSPVITATNPLYSNNYAGLNGQDLTARASAIDLLLQWRYEERNFHLVAAAEVTTLTWNHLTSVLTSSGDIYIQSTHRDSYWSLGTLSYNIPDGSALYFVLDRSLTTTPIDISGSAVVASLGTVPNTTATQQVYVLAFNKGGTLWWRGGNGTRFPATGTQIGQYFVDGSSKSLLDYIGAPDYNASQPAYSSNFSGVGGESLVVRTSKNDELIRTLYQNSNMSAYLSDGGYFTYEGTTLSLTGTLFMAFPHVVGRMTLAAATWTLSDGQCVYLTLNLGAKAGSLAGSDTAVVADTIATTVPLPNAYYDVSGTYTVKYFMLAHRKGSSVFLWDGTELPVGGRYPIPRGRSVVATAAPGTLTSNTYWNGTDFRWEKLALAVGTGIGLSNFADQTAVSPSLTTLINGDALVVTHSWNIAATVTVTKVATPVTLKQNQFIWVQRKGSIIVIHE